MAKQVLSKETVSDSDEEETQTVFTVPSGFKRCKHVKKVSKLRKESKLWLIKIPADLDVNNLKELPLSDNGSEVLKVNGTTYSVSSDPAQENTSNLSLLVADSEDRDSLVCKNAVFDRVLDITKVAQIPDIDYEALRVPRKNVVQFDGLEQKHFATGYSEKDYIKHKDSKKHYHRSNKKDEDDTPSKKKKKKKHSKA